MTPDNKIGVSQIVEMLSHEQSHHPVTSGKMSELRDDISRLLAIEVGHVTIQSELQYGSSYALNIGATSDCASCVIQAAQFKIIIYVSTRMNAFTTLAYEKEWVENIGLAFVPIKSLIPPCLQKWDDEVCEFMSQSGFYLLSGSILSEFMDGFYTELDNQPSNVFEVLFTEMA